MPNQVFLKVDYLLTWQFFIFEGMNYINQPRVTFNYVSRFYLIAHHWLEHNILKEIIVKFKKLNLIICASLNFDYMSNSKILSLIVQNLWQQIHP